MECFKEAGIWEKNAFDGNPDDVVPECADFDRVNEIEKRFMDLEKKEKEEKA